MNQEKLDEINKISEQISETNWFLDCITRTTLYMHIFIKQPTRKRMVFRRPSYGMSPNEDYVVPKELEEEVLNVLRDHREKLIAKQQELWGSE